MLNIAITAGGTSENMDGVRKITNVSTGSLGWYCLEAVLEGFGQQKIPIFMFTTSLLKVLQKKI